MNDLAVRFPRLAVISDVPVERAAAGALLLYRLLAAWPPDRLFVIEGNLLASKSTRRLPGVPYVCLSYSIARIHRTRLVPIINLTLAHLVRLATPVLRRHLTRFGAEAVLTVSHGHLWIAAADAAHANGLPLHVIGHDDWLYTTPVPGWAREAAERIAARIGRRATSWLCVSPAMADEYSRRYGAATITLYPNRGDDSPCPKVRTNSRIGPAVVAFAGSLWAGGYATQLAELAAVLASSGGRVDVYTNHALGPLANVPNVRAAGFLPPRELADRIGHTADILFAPMSFLAAERATVATAFPSKLADYTAIGLPILICGPEYCAAVRWAMDFPGVAEVVTSPCRDALAAAVRGLMADPNRRKALAARGVEVGERCFSLASARKVLGSALARTHR